MEIKVFHFFITMLVVVFFSIIFIKPQSIKNLKSNDIATFEFSNFNIYKITKEKLDLVLMASNGYAFKEKTKIVNLSIAKFLEKGNVEYLTSKIAILKGNNLNFKDKTTYIKSDGLYISTKDLNYNFKDKIVDSKMPFKIDFLVNSEKLGEEKHTFRGDDFIFYKDENKIVANNISATINLK